MAKRLLDLFEAKAYSSEPSHAHVVLETAVVVFNTGNMRDTEIVLYLQGLIEDAEDEVRDEESRAALRLRMDAEDLDGCQDKGGDRDTIWYILNQSGVR